MDLLGGEPEVQLEARVAGRLGQHVARRLGGDAVGPQVLEVAVDPPQSLVTRPVEAPVDQDLGARAQRPEHERGRERAGRRRQRGARADRDAQRQRDRREGGRQPGAQGHVDERPVDQPVDLVQAVPHHRDADGERNRGQRERRGDGGRRALGAADRALGQADDDRGRDQHRRIGEPSQLQALDVRAALHPRPQRQSRRHEAGERAQATDDERDSDDGFGQLGERAGDMLEPLAVALRRQQRPGGEGGERGRGHDGDGAPAGRGQPAVGKDERDRGRADEQRRPRPLMDQDGPLGAGPRARILQSRVVRVRGRDLMHGQHQPVRQQQPSDRVARAAKPEHEPDPARRQRGGRPDREHPGVLAVAAREGVEQCRDGNARDRQACANPWGDPAESHLGPSSAQREARATVLPLQKARYWHWPRSSGRSDAHRRRPT